MPTPPKPFTVLKSEGKSHRTKAELKQRETGEQALVSGTALKERREVKENKVAHREFIRLQKLLKGIGKNDALYEAVINRYCLLQAECYDLTEKAELFFRMSVQLKEEFEAAVQDAAAEEKAELIAGFGKNMASLTKSMIACDKQVQVKRRMLFEIEKECIMTIASALRSIPKKTESKASALLEALGGG